MIFVLIIIFLIAQILIYYLLFMVLYHYSFIIDIINHFKLFIMDDLNILLKPDLYSWYDTSHKNIWKPLINEYSIHSKIY